MAKRILIVDDDVELSEELAEILNDAGHTAEIFPCLGERMPDIRPGDYDVIVLDYKMPHFSGVDLLRALPPLTDRTKVFLVSGRPLVEKMLRGEHLLERVTEVVRKPFSIQELLEKIG